MEQPNCSCCVALRIHQDCRYAQDFSRSVRAVSILQTRRSCSYVRLHVRSAIFKPISSVGSKIGPRLRDRRLEGGRILLDIYYVNSKAILYNKNVALKVKLRDPRRPSRSGVAIRETKRVFPCVPKTNTRRQNPTQGAKMS